MHEAKIIARILINIKNHLEDSDSSKLLRECKYLGSCIVNCVMSAITLYRLQKISGLSEVSLTGQVGNLKTEITELIEILANLVSWQCGICGKTVDAENESQLELWVSAHEMDNDHKRNLM